MTQQEFQIRYKYNPSTDCIGEGGFGKVYKAYDTHLDKLVAIKVAEVKPGQEQVRLKKEVEMVSKLPTHPNIANYEACYTFSSFTGEYDFAVLQYYEEGNLQQLIDSGKLNQTQKETLLRQILEGVGFLHNQDIIHRDLKPQNILIAKRNDEYIPKITDFGISKKLDFNNSSVFTNSLVGGGTMAYASPEQLLGKTIKKNTDLWSFGVIVCQVFTGKLPFSVGRDGINSEAGRIELYKQIVNGTVSFSNNSIPAKWQQLIKQCIVVDNNIRAAKAENCISIFNSNQNLQNGATTAIEGKINNTKTATKEQNPPLKTADGYYHRAIDKINDNKFESAIDDLTEAIKLEKLYGFYFKRGFCYKQLKKYDEAIFDFTEEIKLFGWNTNCISERAQCYESMNLLNKACDDYLTIVERISDRFYFNKWFELAKKVEKQDIIESFLKNWKILLKEERELVLNYSYSKYPNIALESANEYFKRALFKMDSNLFENAINDLNETIKLSISKGIYFKRAVCYQRINKYMNAIFDYGQEIKLSGFDKTILYNRANCYFKHGLFAEAINDHSENLKLFGNQKSVIIARAECYELNGEISNACGDYFAALEINWSKDVFDKFILLLHKSNDKLFIDKLYNFSTERLKANDAKIVLFVKVEFAYSKNDYSKCIKFIEELIEISNTNQAKFIKYSIDKALENKDFKKILLDSKLLERTANENVVIGKRKVISNVVDNFLVLLMTSIFAILTFIFYYWMKSSNSEIYDKIEFIDKMFVSIYEWNSILYSHLGPNWSILLAVISAPILLGIVIQLSISGFSLINKISKNTYLFSVNSFFAIVEKINISLLPTYSIFACVLLYVLSFQAIGSTNSFGHIILGFLLFTFIFSVAMFFLGKLIISIWK